MNTQQKPWWAPDLQTVVALAIIAITSGSLFYRMTHPSAVEDKQLDTMLTIMFSTALVAIINFLYGSSHSEQTKDQAKSDAIIAQIGPQPAPAAPPAALPPAAPPAPGGG